MTTLQTSPIDSPRPHQALLGLRRRLAAGWAGDQPAVVTDFALHWSALLGVETSAPRSDPDAARFTTDLSELRLFGSHPVPCLLLGGTRRTSGSIIQAFYRDTLGYTPIVIACSESAAQQVSEEKLDQSVLIVSPADLEQLLNSPAPRTFLKQLVVQRVDKELLIPFNIGFPAEQAMFFGRRLELQQIRSDSAVSVAVVGPSRIGKTSLFTGCRNVMRRERDPRLANSIFLTFFDCTDRTDDGVAHFLANHLSASAYSSRVTAAEFHGFLLYQRQRTGQVINLFLDEVDLVCNTSPFRVLTEAARSRLCRPVLFGKGALLRAVSDARSPLASRIDIIRLGPLDRPAATELLIEPLRDLQIEITDADRVAEAVLAATGQLPNLVQLFGKKLAKMALACRTPASVEHVETLKLDYDIARFAVRPLLDIEDPLTGRIALQLVAGRGGEINPCRVSALARALGRELTPAQAASLCDELYIANVLTWASGAYRLANPALGEYARGLGLLDPDMWPTGPRPSI